MIKDKNLKVSNNEVVGPPAVEGNIQAIDTVRAITTTTNTDIKQSNESNHKNLSIIPNIIQENSKKVEQEDETFFMPYRTFLLLFYIHKNNDIDIKELKKEHNNKIDDNIEDLIDFDLIEINDDIVKITDKGNEHVDYFKKVYPNEYNNDSVKFIEEWGKQIETITENEETEELEELSVDKWLKEYKKLPEHIQDQITSLSENLKRRKTVSQLTKEFIEILNTDKQIRKILGDKFKLQTTIAILSNRYTPKAVDLEELIHKDEIPPEEKKNLERLAKKNFGNQNLLFLITDELDKDHVGDPNGKLTGFLVCCSGKLEPEYRLSITFRGDSSTGKTNLMKTVLSHLPPHWYAWGSRFTRASLEDDIDPFPIVVFAEKTKEDDVVESLKELSEDGLQVWKHDKETNKLRDVKFIDRKVSLSSSTEKQTDEELATRGIVYTVTSNTDKTGDIVDDITYVFSKVELQSMKRKRKNKPTWITVGLQNLKGFDFIVVPYSQFICFSDDTSRITRDSKRFLNLICVVAWLSQDNRASYIDEDEKSVLVADLDDFFWVALLTGDIFKQSISNIDKDIDVVINKYREMVKQKKHVVLTNVSRESAMSRKKLYWIRTSDMIKETGISYFKLMKRFNVLHQKGVIEFCNEGRGGGEKKYFAITNDPFKVDLLKHDFEKTYFVLKTLEEELKIKNDKMKISILFSKMKKNHKDYPKNIKFENGGVLKLKIKDDKFNEIIGFINKKLKSTDKEEKELVRDYNRFGSVSWEV